MAKKTNAKKFFFCLLMFAMMITILLMSNPTYVKADELLTETPTEINGTPEATTTSTTVVMENQCATHAVFITLNSEQINFCAPTSLAYNVVEDNTTDTNSAYAQLNQISEYGVIRIQAIAPGNAPGVGLPIYELGNIENYRNEIWENDVSHTEQITTTGPNAVLWNEEVSSIQIDATLSLSEGVKTVRSYEWFVEHNNRLWYITAIWDLGISNQNEWETALENFSIVDSDNRNTQDTAIDLGSISPSSDISAQGSVVDVGTPSWWNGTCDDNNYYSELGIHSFPLGSSWHNVPACGPRPFTITYGQPGNPGRVERFFSGAWGEYEFQCVELVMRFLYQEWGITPWSGNGNTIINNYPTNSITYNSNGTHSIVPGDILTENSSTQNSAGHTAIITSVNLDSNGTGTINILEQNANSGGSRSLHVTTWNVDPDAGIYSQTIQGWLHVKANDGSGGNNNGTNCYSLSLNVNGGGTLTASPSTSTCGYLSYPTGTTVQLTATPNSGWHFSGWSGGPSGGSTTNYTINGNSSVTAIFAQDSVIPNSSWAMNFYSDNNLGSQCGSTVYDNSGVYIFQDSDVGWAPPSGCPSASSAWSVRMERSVYFQGGTYNFGMFYDDGARLYVDGVLKVDGWSATQHYESHFISSGNHNVKVEYKNNAGHAIIQLWWRGPGALPGNDQTQDLNQWWVNYWGNQTQWQDSVGQENEGNGFINHDWSSNGPGFGIPGDHFSIKYERTVAFQCGVYRFHVKSDDGSRLSIDGAVIPQFDHWTTAVYDTTADLLLQPGNHLLKLDYFENGGGANVYLDWTRVGDCTPATPTNLQSSSSNPTSVTLTWSDVSNEDGYNIYRWDGSTATFVYFDSVGQNVTSYTETRPACGWDQYYEISAFNSYGESPLTGWTHVYTQACPPPPAFDSIIAPLNITSVPYLNTQDTTAATLASDDPALPACHRTAGYASVWYKYVPGTTREVSLDTFGSNYDTMIGVWSGAPGSLTAVTCNDDYGSLQSQVTFSASQGTSYYIGISQYSGYLAGLGANEEDLKDEGELTSQAGGALVLHATTFADVPGNHMYWRYVEGFYAMGITGGCAANPKTYCPDRGVTRAEMAVFILRAKNGLSTPTPNPTGMFSDVPVLGKEWMKPWIEKFYNEGITTGCSASPLQYCPEREVTRAEMAVFILRAKHGAGYQPPAATGIFSDVPVTGKEWMRPWVEQFYREGITTGCAASPLRYCPEQTVTRGEMAVFIDRAFGYSQLP